MKYKKSFLIICLIICLFSIASVCAIDVNETTVTSGDQSDVISVDETTDGALSVEEANEVVSVEDNQVVLGNGSNVGTFDELSSLIGNASVGGTLELNKDYQYVNGSNEGIQIINPITVDGKGHILDGNNQSRIFGINSNNVILKNIKFTNAYSMLGSAISTYCENITIINSTFINCVSHRIDDGWGYRGGDGAAIYYGENTKIINCNFINCDGDYGIINGEGTCSYCLNCNFYDCFSIISIIGYDLGHIKEIKNCSFVNCYSNVCGDGAIDGGGAINAYVDKIIDCKFINCSSSSNGGAIAPMQGTYIDNCLFDNNNATLGKSIYIKTYQYFEDYPIIINNSYFLQEYGNVYVDGDCNLIFIKKSLFILMENILWDYKTSPLFNIRLTDMNTSYNEPIIFNIYNEDISHSYEITTDELGINYLRNILTDLDVGTWNVSVTFEGNDNYYPCNATATITVLPASSSLTIEDVNTTWDQETSFTAKVMSNNKTVNEGTVSFFIDNKFIGDASVVNGTSTLIHEAPGDAGNHVFSAIYNGINYLSSNSTAKMFVGTGDIEVEDYDSIATFKALAELIENAPEGSVLNLTKDYIYISGSNEGIRINKKITVNGNGHTLNANNLSRIFKINIKDVTLKNIIFINGKSVEGGAVFNEIFDSTLTVMNSTFVNCNAYRYSTEFGYSGGFGGAIFYNGMDTKITGCNFINCHGDYGVVDGTGDNSYCSECNFENCSSLNGIVRFDLGSNFTIFNCNFNYCSCEEEMSLFIEEIRNCSYINCHSNGNGGAICGYVNKIADCNFINCSSSLNGGAIAPLSDTYIENCFFDNNDADLGKSIYIKTPEYSEPLKITINNSYFSQKYDNVYVDGDCNLNFIKKNLFIFMENLLWDYKTSPTININLTDKKSTFYEPIIFKICKGNISHAYEIITDEVGINILRNNLTDLDAGIWDVAVIFEGNDNYAPCNVTATINVLSPSTSVTIDDVNTTTGHEVTLIANVNSTLTVNEGTVTFFDGETNIGEVTVNNGIASLNYTPVSAGEHTITAIFNSSNYLTSNSTVKLLVDNATVEILVNTGTVGFESDFVANVKGLYSIINEGTVTFYINDECLGQVNVVNGSANLSYAPFVANDYIVKAVFSNSSKFLDDESSSIYTVKPADSNAFINDLNGTVGYELTLTVNITSSNNLTINEGTVTFYDSDNYAGESNVTGGIATLTYTPTTAGEHTITAIYNADNYQNSNDAAVLSVAKANIDLIINSIADVYFTNPSNFAVNASSNSKGINEGEIKFYVNDVLVGTSNVNNGEASFNYVANTTGSLTLKVIYNETQNYLESNTTASFQVNKMPTTLTGESVIFDEQDYKTFTTVLKDDNNDGVDGKPVKIEVIKYSGESATFNGISDSNGITIYDVGRLAGGMWYVTGIYAGDDDYMDSRFVDKFIVVRMNTTTAIEEIENPQVNKTYKLKANIHDENGKLVKEGIVGFYLDGVYIGSIDLSKNKLNSNGKGDLLGVAFGYALSDDGNLSGMYLEYTPTKAGKFSLSAVYEGTTIYKASNSTTTFTVAEAKTKTTIIASSVTTVYNGNKYLVAILKDTDNKTLSGFVVSVNLNGVKNLTTDENGQVKVSTNGLTPNTYEVTITFAGDENYTESNTTTTVVINKDSPELAANEVTTVYNVGKDLVITLTDSQGNALSGFDVSIDLNGVKTLTTDSSGQVKVSTNGLTAKTYDVLITFGGNENYTESNTTTKVVVNKDSTKLTASAITTTYNVNKNLVVTLKDSQGKALNGVTVSVNINGAKAYTTDKNGQVKVAVGSLVPKVYTAKISFVGNDNYKTSSVNVKLTVKKATPKLNAKAKTFKRTIKIKKYTVTLKTNQNKVMKNIKVTIKVNKKTYAAKTNKKGIATFKITKLTKKGKYAVVVKFAGNKYYNAKTVKSKINVM